MDDSTSMKERVLVAAWFASRAASRVLPWLIALACGLFALVWLTACASTPPAAPPADAEIEAAVNAARADGAWSAGERADIAALLARGGGAGGIDWEVVGSAAASVVLSFFGVNLYRNRTSPARTAADLVKLDTPPETGKHNL